MDIKITSRNKIFRRIDTGVALLLIEAFPTIFEPANPEQVNLTGINGNVQAPRPTVASEWGLARSQIDQRVIGLRITVAGGETVVVSGAADGILSRCQKALAGRPAPLPTDELVRAYAHATQAVDADAVMETARQQRLRLEEAQRNQNARTLPDAVAQVVAEGRK